jgi:lysophospholipase L1-like esterase
VNDRCVLFFGDSFVNGAGDATGLGWPGRLVAAAWDDGLPLTAYNLGIRGESTREVALRFRAEAGPRLIPDADNRVVIAVGANDVSLDENGEREVATEESIRLMSGMLDTAVELGATAMLLSPGPAGIPDHDARSRELGERFASLCRERDLRYVDVLDDLLTSEPWARTARANDGLHPNEEGYAVLAQLVLDAGWLNWLRT